MFYSTYLKIYDKLLPCNSIFNIKPIYSITNNYKKQNYFIS